MGDVLRRPAERVDILEDPAPDALARAPGPIILVGNLADSAAVRDLYFRFLCATDLWYPGPGGHEVRRLTNPFGNGYDGLLVGYSDAAGAEAAAEKALRILAAPDAPTFDVHATRLPMADDHVREIRETRLNPDEIFMDRGLTNADWKGFLYYLIGEEQLGAEYRAVWRKYLTLKCMHLCSLNKFLPFMLCESMGAFTPDDRAAIYRYIYDWAEGPEGYAIVNQARASNGPATPRSNHELIPALALVYVSEFFKARFPTLPEPWEWRRIADQTYANLRSSWKDNCDGLCHDWFLSQPAIVLYGLIDPAHRFYHEGGARAAAECAIAIVNNDGWMPSAGHSDLYRQFPGPTLRTAAAWFNDGRYRFVHELAPLRRRLTWRAPVGFLRAFDNGVAPVEPRGQIGITVIPVDPAYYNKYASYPPNVAEYLNQPPPDVPLAQCFDKIAVRAGWKRDDDYLLLDGITGGGHSFNDACGILDYARFGVSCLVGANMENGLNTDMIVVRGAAIGPSPEYARLEARESGADGAAYLRMTLPDYGGADWTREIYLRPGGALVVCDTIVARVAGDYAAEAIFRVPGKATLEGRAWRWCCRAPAGARVDFHLAGLPADGAMMTASVAPDKTWGETEAGRRVWEERYHNRSYAITECRTRMAGAVRAGGVLRLAHIAQIRGPEEPELRLTAENGQLTVVGGKAPWILRDWPEQASAAIAPDGAGAAAPRHDRPAVRAPQADAAGHGKIRLMPVFSAGSPIACLQPVADGMLAGTEHGEVIRLDPSGKTLWHAQVAGPVRCVAGYVEGGVLKNVLAGFGARGIWIGTGAGEKIKQFEFQYRETAWPWWQSPGAGVVAAVGLLHAGQVCFVVGTGDGYVHLYDQEGRETWHVLFPSLGLPGYLRIVRYGQSDARRILVAASLQAYRAHLLLLDLDGGFVAAPPSLTPVGAACSGFAVASIGKRFVVAAAATCDPSLQLFDLARLDDLSPYPIKAHIPAHAPADDPRRFSGCRIWESSLGGEVTGVAFDAGAKRVFAATRLGFVAAHDLDGQRLWHRLFPAPLTQLARAGAALLAADQAGAIHILSPSGEALGQAACPGLRLPADGESATPWGWSAGKLYRLEIF